MQGKKKGLTHIYTGDGKGKTTAAIGLGIRAVGHDMKVLIAQFLKGRYTGELEVLKKLGNNFLVIRHKEIKKFTCDMTEDELIELKTEVVSLFNRVVNEANTGNWDMIILDEIMASVSLGFISSGKLLQFIKSKPECLELVLTGRGAGAELIAAADYVSEIKMIKHPMQMGINARSGVEF
ncbi:MAG: cob(I)yrinic acid a,c-diamide adenosyltransferase [Ruminiclostridium sp.]|nr:cob(I)yrinic acid a,c-diamide adenosyltransferase [Ruminiclostridium sp.]